MPYSYRSISRPGRNNSGNRRNSGYSGGGRGRSSGRRTGQYIDPARFVSAAKSSTTAVEAYVPTHKFEDFALNELLQKNLKLKGYTDPTPIQDQTIPEALIGRDLIGIANTGTGKTAAFALPIMDMLISTQHAKALIIAPTRELAQQIEGECRWMGKGSGLFGTLLIGGSAMGPQLRDLRDNPRIVIGTPGRIKDHLERGTLNLARFNMVVLDEVDRMLDMGFITDVTSILSRLPEQRQSFFFSATMDGSVRTLIDRFSKDPVVVSIKTGDTTELVDQDVVPYISSHEKIDKLHDILLQSHVSKAIVFDETQRSVERLSNELLSRGFKADAIHGGKTQGQRQRALKRFKDNDISILVATDVAARGIDITDISHVINYSTPQSYDDYVHRIGRAGRNGNTGYALTFVNK